MNFILSKTLFRQKKLVIIYSSLLILSFLSLFSVNAITNYIKDEKINSIIENEDNRRIYIHPSESKNFYNKIKKLQEVENIYYDYRFQSISFDNYIMELVSNNQNKNKEIILGRSILENSTDEILIPDRYYGMDNYDAKHYLSRTINISYDGIDIQLHIVGIYKNQNDINQVYVSENNSFVDTLNYDCVVIVNTQSQVTSIANYVESIGHSVDFVDINYQSEVIIYQRILNILTFIRQLFIIFLLILILLLIFSIILEEKYNIAILKLCGYSNINLIKNLLLLLLFVYFISYIISLFIYYINFVFINHIFCINLLGNYYYFLWLSIKILIIILIIVLLSVIFFSKIKLIKLFRK